MDTEDKKIAIGLFHNHYGVLLFKRRMGSCCRLRSVPRSLSSSCGTCAELEYSGSEAEMIEAIRNAADENADSFYVEENGTYRKIYEF